MEDTAIFAHSGSRKDIGPTGYPGTFTNFNISLNDGKGLHGDVSGQFGFRVYGGERRNHAYLSFVMSAVKKPSEANFEPTQACPRICTMPRRMGSVNCK